MRKIIQSLFFNVGDLSWAIYFVEQGEDMITIQVESDSGSHSIPLLLSSAEMRSCVNKLNLIKWNRCLSMNIIHMIIAGAASYSMKRH